MDGSSSETVEEYYNNLSAAYDELYGEEQTAKHNRVVGLLGNRTFGVLVDVGCATGNLLSKVEEKCDVSIGIDISSQMLRKARAKLGCERVGFIRGDSKALPIRSGCVDCVLTVSMLDSSDENCRSRILEVRRIAKRTGTLALTIFHSDKQAIVIEKFGLPLPASIEDISKIETLCVIRPYSTVDS